MRSSLNKIWAVSQISSLELYRRKDVYVVAVLGLVIIIPLASINLFGVSGVYRYLSEISLLLIWLFSIVIGIATASRQIPAELERRTIYPLLSKPVGRHEIILGKFIGACTATGTCLVVFYLLFALLSGLKQGVWIDLGLVQALVLHLCFVALLTAMVIAGSLYFSSSANITLSSLVCVGMLLFGERLPAAVEQSSAPMNIILGALHWIVPHFELMDLRLRLVHGWPPLAPHIFLLVLVYGLLCTTAFLALSFALFKRKQL